MLFRSAGVYKFLQRVWNLTQLFVEAKPEATSDQYTQEILASTHRAIKKVSQDIESMSFNTAIAALMKFTNELYEINKKDKFNSYTSWEFALKTLTQLLAPFAPHIAEELWSNLGAAESVHISEWPVHDEAYLVQKSVKIAVMVNGKVRGEIEMPLDADQAIVEPEALKNNNVSTNIKDRPIKKVVFVKNKIINFVI